MAPAPAACICADRDGPADRRVDVCLHEMVRAVNVDDLDNAIETGLLRWNGCIACAIAEGLRRPDIERLIDARDARMSALSARERHRARQQRLQRRSEQRDARRQPVSRATASAMPLPPAAAAALARAKAKAAARAKP